jgi:hypothetical protein
MPASYASYGPVAKLAVATVTPMALTLAPEKSGVLAAGMILAAVLVKMTFNPEGPPPKTYDESVEQKAIKTVVMRFQQACPSSPWIRILVCRGNICI